MRARLQEFAYTLYTNQSDISLMSVCVLSHGDENCIKTIDGQGIRLDEVKHFFDYTFGTFAAWTHSENLPICLGGCRMTVLMRRCHMDLTGLQQCPGFQDPMVLFQWSIFTPHKVQLR